MSIIKKIYVHGNIAKKMLIPLLLFCSVRSIAQQPPPSFTFNYQRLANIKDSLLKRYTFATYNFKDSVQQEQGNKLDWEKERLLRWADGKNVQVFIYSENLAIAYKGTVVRLSITDRYQQKTMNIFIRVAFDVGFGDEIVLDNLKFYTGNYFLDICGSSPRYNTRAKHNPVKTTIDLSRVKRNKISISLLNTILKDHSCIKDLK